MMSKLGREAQRYYPEHTVFCNNCCGSDVVILPTLSRQAEVFFHITKFSNLKYLSCAIIKLGSGV